MAQLWWGVEAIVHRIHKGLPPAIASHAVSHRPSKSLAFSTALVLETNGQLKCPRRNRYTDSQSTCASRQSSTASDFNCLVHGQCHRQTCRRSLPRQIHLVTASGRFSGRFCTACDDRRHEACLCRHRASRHHKFREGLRIHASLQSEVHGTFERPAQGNWPPGARNDQGLLQEICELWRLVSEPFPPAPVKHKV